MGRTACTELQCLYSRATPLLPYGPYGLYRASVPVPYSYSSTPPMGRTVCTESQCLYSRAIPLLPLWAVRPVQSLSACTVDLYLYSPYEPYVMYRASVPLQGEGESHRNGVWVPEDGESCHKTRKVDRLLKMGPKAFPEKSFRNHHFAA
jgi:hypothetical protein